MFKKIFLFLNSIVLTSVSAAGNDAEQVSIQQASEVFDENAYKLQKEICTRFLNLENLGSLTPQQIYDLSLLESLLQNITTAPMTYCEDIVMYRPGRIRDVVK